MISYWLKAEIPFTHWLIKWIIIFKVYEDRCLNIEWKNLVQIDEFINMLKIDIVWCFVNFLILLLSEIRIQMYLLEGPSCSWSWS
jgi:hypothetical protein